MKTWNTNNIYKDEHCTGVTVHNVLDLRAYISIGQGESITIVYNEATNSCCVRGGIILQASKLNNCADRLHELLGDLQTDILENCKEVTLVDVAKGQVGQAANEYYITHCMRVRLRKVAAVENQEMFTLSFIINTACAPFNNVCVAHKWFLETAEFAISRITAELAAVANIKQSDITAPSTSSMCITSYTNRRYVECWITRQHAVRVEIGFDNDMRFNVESIKAVVYTKDARTRDILKHMEDSNQTLLICGYPIYLYVPSANNVFCIDDTPMKVCKIMSMSADSSKRWWSLYETVGRCCFNISKSSLVSITRCINQELEGMPRDMETMFDDLSKYIESSAVNIAEMLMGGISQVATGQKIKMVEVK